MSYSDYKKDKLIMENWRRFLNEGDFSDRLTMQFNQASNDGASEDAGILGQNTKIAVLLAETVMRGMDIYGNRVDDGGVEQFLKIFNSSPKLVGGNLEQSHLDSLNSAESMSLIIKHIPVNQIDYDEFARGSGDPPDIDTIEEMLNVVRKAIQQENASFALIGAALRSGVLVKMGDELSPA